MADIQSIGGEAATGAYNIAVGIGGLLPWVFGAVVVVAICVWIYFQRQYNRQVLLFKIAGSGYRLIPDKAKLWKDKNGVSFWKAKKTKLWLSVPPSECLIAAGGGDLAMGYVSSIGEVLWCVPGYKPNEVLEKIENNKRIREANKHLKAGELPMLEDNMTRFEQQVEEFLVSFRPVSTTSRALYAYQQDEAKKHLKLDFFKQNIPIIIGGIFVILILAVFLMLGPKMIEQYNAIENQMAGHVTEWNEQRLEQLRLLESLYGKVQHIESSLNITNQGVPN